MSFIVTIIIPVYNHASFIEECIRSIWKQDKSNIEIIAYDDGSTDKSFDILVSLQRISPVVMKVFSHPNVGSSKTVNEALEHASGQYIMMIASDDFYIDGAFDKLFDIISCNPNCNLVYTNGLYFKSFQTTLQIHDGIIRQKLSQNSSELLNYITRNVPRPLLVQSCIIRKTLLDAIDGLDEEAIIDDWALNIKMLTYLVTNNYTHIYFNLNLLCYRIHSNNYHSNSLKMLNGIEQIAFKYISNRAIRYKLLAREFLYYGVYLFKEFNFKIGIGIILKCIKYTVNFIKFSIVQIWI